MVWEKGKITNKARKQVGNTSKGRFREALNMDDMLMTESKNSDKKTC